MRLFSLCMLIVSIFASLQGMKEDPFEAQLARIEKTTSIKRSVWKKQCTACIESADLGGFNLLLQTPVTPTRALPQHPLFEQSILQQLEDHRDRTTASLEPGSWPRCKAKLKALFIVGAPLAAGTAGTVGSFLGGEPVAGGIAAGGTLFAVCNAIKPAWREWTLKNQENKLENLLVMIALLKNQQTLLGTSPDDAV